MGHHGPVIRLCQLFTLSRSIRVLLSASLALVPLTLEAPHAFAQKAGTAKASSKPAGQDDIFLYRGMGSSYVCNASTAKVEFPKAVGIAAAGRFPAGGTKICLATAHPAKFPETVNQAVGAEVAVHPALEALSGLESRTTRIPATVEAVKEAIQTSAR